MLELVSANIPAHVTVFATGAQNTQLIYWEFDRADPFAVRFVAPNGDDEGIEWVFARSILTEALDAQEDVDVPPAGVGDVEVSASDLDVVIYLSNGQGQHAALLFDRFELEKFVTASYQVVPPQGVPISEDLDDFLTDLLGYSPNVVAETVVPRPTKTITFDDRTYIVPADAPDDIDEWEAELLHHSQPDQDHNEE